MEKAEGDGREKRAEGSVDDMESEEESSRGSGLSGSQSTAGTNDQPRFQAHSSAGDGEWPAEDGTTADCSDQGSQSSAPRASAQAQAQSSSPPQAPPQAQSSSPSRAPPQRQPSAESPRTSATQSVQSASRRLSMTSPSIPVSLVAHPAIGPAQQDDSNSLPDHVASKLYHAHDHIGKATLPALAKMAPLSYRLPSGAEKTENLVALGSSSDGLEEPPEEVWPKGGAQGEPNEGTSTEGLALATERSFSVQGEPEDEEDWDDGSTGDYARPKIYKVEGEAWRAAASVGWTWTLSGLGGWGTEGAERYVLCAGLALAFVLWHLSLFFALSTLASESAAYQDLALSDLRHKAPVFRPCSDVCRWPAQEAQRPLATSPPSRRPLDHFRSWHLPHLPCNDFTCAPDYETDHVYTNQNKELAVFTTMKEESDVEVKVEHMWGARLGAAELEKKKELLGTDPYAPLCREALAGVLAQSRHYLCQPERGRDDGSHWHRPVNLFLRCHAEHEEQLDLILKIWLCPRLSPDPYLNDYAAGRRAVETEAGLFCLHGSSATRPSRSSRPGAQGAPSPSAAPSNASGQCGEGGSLRTYAALFVLRKSPRPRPPPPPSPSTSP